MTENVETHRRRPRKPILLQRDLEAQQLAKFRDRCLP
jgi:hypothetical protein